MNFDLLHQARDSQRVLRIAYRKWRDPLPCVRDIEVYAVDFEYVNAYCRLREDPRVFLVDRIFGARLLSEEFPIRPELESHFLAVGWVGRSDEWRREQRKSIQDDRWSDRLLVKELRG